MTSSGSTCLASPAIVVVSLTCEIDSKNALGFGNELKKEKGLGRSKRGFLILMIPRQDA